MSKYRDKLQIVANILTIASGKAKKTRIMYQANLSYKLLCRYLGEVQNAGLVVCENNECYVLTTKGREFLSRHDKYSRRCRSLEAHLSHINVEKAALEEMCFKADKVKNNSNCLNRSN